MAKLRKCTETNGLNSQPFKNNSKFLRDFLQLRYSIVTIRLQKTTHGGGRTKYLNLINKTYGTKHLLLNVGLAIP